MKFGFTLALLIAVAGQVLYHVTQKQVAPGAHPVLSLLAFYAGAAVLSPPLFWLFPLQGSLAAEASKFNLAVWGVAAAIVLIELGFLLAYRAGGSLSSSFVVSAAAVTSALALIGVLAFGERLPPTKLAGIALSLAGIWLASRGSD